MKQGIKPSDWTLLCDFDGTISLEDTTDTLLDRFGRPGWEKLESDWRAGRIGSRECMGAQVALLDMSRSELDAHLAARAIDPAFADFVHYAQTHGMHVEVLSDGLDYAIRAILARYGMDHLPITANALEPGGERAWRLAFPNANAQCRAGSGTCKCARAAAFQTARSTPHTRQRVLMIGDGASDHCVAAAADFVFAKGKLVRHCRANRIAHMPISGFADALALLPALAAGRIGPDAAVPLAKIASA